MAAAYYGVGRHYQDLLPLSQTTTTPMLKLIYATRILYVLSLMFVKTSLLLFYLRLDPRRWMKYTVYGLLVIVIDLSIASVCILAFSCFPPSKFWDLSVDASDHCMDAGRQQTFYEANGVLNIVTDICIYIVPIPMLWGVRISMRRKGAIFAIFSIGILSIAAGCVRYDFVRKLASNPDQYYYLADSLNWCSIEIYVAIFCGSAPSLSVLVKTYAPAMLGSTGRADNSHGLAHVSNQGPSHRFSSRPSQNRRFDDTVDLLAVTVTGSQEEIIPGHQGKGEGIMMKTDIRMEVFDPAEGGVEADINSRGFEFWRE
ncbi:uncharacterized protein BDV14DRAFT_200185 [Aspergillus stella-maris]|uniref:uncharacterized protein n=1 Tax=Aspergillus stella-maris TaxID=1810926 RepID=UPI003CCD51C9